MELRKMELVSRSSPLRYSSFGAIHGGRVGHLPQEFASKSPLGLCYYESTHTLLINANFQVSGEFLSGPPAYGGLVISKDDVRRPFRRMRRQRHSLSISFFAGDAPGAVFLAKRAGIIDCDVSIIV